MPAIDRTNPAASEGTMYTDTHDLRCKACSALLAKRDESGVSIRRGDLQATIDGDFRAVIVCYKSRCRTLNIFSGERTARPKAMA